MLVSLVIILGVFAGAPLSVLTEEINITVQALYLYFVEAEKFFKAE